MENNSNKNKNMFEKTPESTLENKPESIKNSPKTPERTLFTLIKEYFKSLKRRRPFYFVFVSFFLTILVFMISVSVIPSKYSRYTPGGVSAVITPNQVKGDYKFEDKEYLKDYKFANIFSVSVFYEQRISLLDYWISKNFSGAIFYKRRPNLKTDAIRGKLMMRTSLENSVIAAYKAANLVDEHIKIETEFLGLEIQESTYPVNGDIQGGIIIKILDTSKPSLSDFSALIKDKKQITVTLLKDDRTFEKTLLRNPEDNLFGLSLSNKSKIINTTPKIKITENPQAGGPSGGMMQALSIYHALLRKNNLPSEIRIAGSGTLTESGIVGPIGAVNLKVRAAVKAKCNYFLCYQEDGKNDNYQDALNEQKKLKAEIKIIPIKTFGDVINFINTEFKE